jgi:hypothetical protein
MASLELTATYTVMGTGTFTPGTVTVMVTVTVISSSDLHHPSVFTVRHHVCSEGSGSVFSFFFRRKNKYSGTVTETVAMLRHES